jgi:hypothetical protein
MGTLGHIEKLSFMLSVFRSSSFVFERSGSHGGWFPERAWVTFNDMGSLESIVELVHRLAMLRRTVVMSRDLQTLFLAFQNIVTISIFEDQVPHRGCFPKRDLGRFQ